jgi:hypothetical protein
MRDQVNTTRKDKKIEKSEMGDICAKGDEQGKEQRISRRVKCTRPDTVKSISMLLYEVPGKGIILPLVRIAKNVTKMD